VAAGLAWLPFLVLGARRGSTLTLPALGVGAGLAWGVAALHADQDPLRAALWALVATPLALVGPREQRPTAPPADLLVRPGLRGMLLSIVLQTSALALAGSLVGGATALLMGMPEAVSGMFPGITFTLGALLPLLPPGALPGRPLPMAPEVLFRLPVHRTRTTLTLMLAGLVRAAIVGVISGGVQVVAFGPVDPRATALVAITVLTAAPTMAAVGALGGTTRTLVAWAVITVGALATVAVAMEPSRSLAWAVGGQLVVLAIGLGALARSSGWVGGTGRAIA
jgi:hypothetical protein